MTELATEMPRCFSISIQSEVAWRLALRPLTAPAIWIAPENSSSFSVSVVLPASGWEMMAKVRSEEHTSELQSQSNLVCRLLLEKKKKNYRTTSRRTDLHNRHHNRSYAPSYLVIKS